MKLNPVCMGKVNFRADNTKINIETGEYEDPLMRAPLRYAAYTNEVGEALRPLIGNTATLTWFPAMAYIGADVYDKYKNNQREYSPESSRALKQALFQILASVILPTVAVKIGQNIIAFFAKFSHEKLSLNTKEHISKSANNYIANGKLQSKKSDDFIINEFKTNVRNNLDYTTQENASKNPLKKLLIKTEELIEKVLYTNKKTAIDNYSEKTIKNLLELQKSIINGDSNKNSEKWINIYNKSINDGQSKNIALQKVLSKYQDNKMLEGKFIKTIGGFIALGFAIKPIDNFVENVLIEKYVGPKIDNIKSRKTK